MVIQGLAYIAGMLLAAAIVVPPALVFLGITKMYERHQQKKNARRQLIDNWQRFFDLVDKKYLASCGRKK